VKIGIPCPLYINNLRKYRVKVKRLEQLRLLETGAKYLCVETDTNLIGVDTMEDLEKVRKIFANR